MKRVLAVLLTATIAFTMTGVATFADDLSLPVFAGRQAVFPLANIPQEIALGDALTFAIHPDNFVWGEYSAGFDSANPSFAEYLAALEIVTDSACFTVQPFSIYDATLLTFDLKAAAVTDSAATFSICVRDKIFGVSSLVYSFSVQIKAPEPEQPQPVATDDYAYITAFSAGSAPVAQNPVPALAVGDMLLYLVPDDNFVWNNDLGAKTYDMQVLNIYAAQAISAPDEFSRQFVLSDGNLYIQLTAAFPGVIENAPVGLYGEQAILNTVILPDGNTQWNEEGAGGGEEELPPEDDAQNNGAKETGEILPDDKQDGGTEKTAAFTPMAAAIATDITGIANSGGAWQRDGTAASPDIIPVGDKVTFVIPDDNFLIDAATTLNNVDYLNANHKNDVKITGNGVSITNFTAEFKLLNGNYAVDITFTSPVILAGGTTFGFHSISTRYALGTNSPMYVGEKITSVAAAPAAAWLPVVLPSGTVASSTTLEFTIPASNFIGTYLDTSNTALVDALKSKIRIYNGGMATDPVQGNFSYAIGHEYDRATGNYRIYVRMTPNAATGFTLRSGTTFGFENAAATTRLASPLTFSSNSAVVSGNKINGVAGVLGDGTTTLLKNGALCGEDLGSLEPVPGDEYFIAFNSDFFSWTNAAPSPAGTLTSTVLRSSRVSIRITSQMNSKVFDTIELSSKNNAAGVLIKFIDPFVSTKELDFRTKVYVQVGNTRYLDSTADIEGTLANNEISFYDDDDEIDLSYGDVGFIEELIRNVDVYIGEGVTIRVPFLRKNAKIYGAVTIDDYTGDNEEVLDRHPEIEHVYHLHTIGLNATANTVTFDADSNYYVYNSYLEYLGRAKQKLPYSTVYYMAVRELKITAADLPDGEDFGEPDTPLENWGTGTSSSSNANTNKNDNPATGK